MPWGVTKTVEFVASMLLAATVILLATQVTLRFGLNAPRTWIEEVSRYAFVWVVFAGALVAFGRGSHIRVTMISDRFGPRTRAILGGLNQALTLVVFVVCLYYGFQLALKNIDAPFYTLDFMPLVIFYLAAPVCLSAAVAISVASLVRSKRRPGDRAND